MWNQAEATESPPLAATEKEGCTTIGYNLIRTKHQRGLWFTTYGNHQVDITETPGGENVVSVIDRSDTIKPPRYQMHPAYRGTWVNGPKCKTTRSSL